MEQERLIEGDFQVLGDSSSSNGVDTPQVGMCFSAEEEVRDFYKSYAQILGFGIAKLGSKKGDDGQLKYFSFGCSKNVMVKRNITIVPENYILERWRKDIKRGYQGITNIYDDSYHHAEERQRYNNLQPLLQEVGQLGSKNDERCFVLTGILKEAKKRIMDINIGDSFDGYQDNNKIYEESRNESKQFHSPLKVRSRGRPPMKRKQSKIEQIVKKTKTKSQKKSSTVDKKQDELSNMNSPSMIDDESSKNVSCDFTRLCTKAYAGEMELMTKERICWIYVHDI
ncbi:hypothetical protein ZIOFF_056705 [Zingiber officinale]|uniref:Protein FAR1-RELATED SEQUENCE n=1 Tax=Zingiber officinale TaxID=94328 RepID=A0A8J5FIE1_ZINOF|nr:hypothetical protein ZIOFF_056705 [Zingiber officinale]